jgi:Cu+-exporting ATPase
MQEACETQYKSGSSHTAAYGMRKPLTLLSRVLIGVFDFVPPSANFPATGFKTHVQHCCSKKVWAEMSLPSHLPTTTLLLPNMHCPSCAETITQLLSPIRSISDINVSLLLRTVTFATNTRSSTSSGRAEKITRREVVDVLMREGGFIVETEEGQPIKLQTRKLDLDVRAYGLGSWMRGGLSGPTRKQILAMRKEAKRREIHAAHCNACREGRSLVASGTELEPEATGDIEVFRTTLSVRGMTCASCTTSIHSALSSFDDILDVDVNLLASCAVVRHRSTFSAKQVKTAIEDIGFQCDVTSSVADLSDPEGDINKIRTTISIEGMTCASCSSTVSAALREVSGVDQVVVDVIGNKGVVVHAKGVTAEAICLAVEGVGYGAAIISSEPLSFRGTESFERTVKITVSGIYCHECVSKLNRYLALLPVKSTQFTTQSHTTTIKYTPREPLTIRDILKGLSNVSPEFQAVLVRETSLNDRSKDIQKREVRMLLTHWIMAFVFTIPTFVM